jgi:hypothetical protein
LLDISARAAQQIAAVDLFKRPRNPAEIQRIMILFES